MTVVLFLLVLGLLIFVHELGHFLMAKAFGIRVDEFAIGFPPVVWQKKVGETLYRLNLVPFGGYVKILGENNDGDPSSGDRTRNLSYRPWWQKALVLLGGVFFNIIFAFFVFAVVFMIGAPVAIDGDTPLEFVRDQRVVIVDVLPDSPAFLAGVLPGDEVVGFEGDTLSSVVLSESIVSSGSFTATLARGGEVFDVSVSAVDGVIDGRPGVGISMYDIGTLKLPFFRAIGKGVNTTLHLTDAVFVGLIDFIRDAFSGDADIDQLAGPVGIASMVGDAKQAGLVQLLQFIAFISINLAVLNVLPFPALDGGRLFVVTGEAIVRRRMSARLSGIINGVGFFILIGLLIFITIRDIGAL